MNFRTGAALISLLCFVTLNSQSALSPIDSLKALLNQPADDTTRMNQLSALLELTGPNEEGQKYNAEISKLAIKGMSNPDSAIARRSRIHYASSLGNSGYIAEINGDIPTALANYQEALAISRAEKKSETVAALLNNIGYVYNGLGDIPTCINYYEASLAIRDSIKDLEGIATCLNNLATVYRDQGETDTALIYFQRFRDICIITKDSSGLALALTNIGNVYLLQHDTANALAYLNDGLAVSRSISTGDDRGIAHALLSLGNYSFEAKRYIEARDYYESSLEYQYKANYRKGIATSKLKLAQTELILGNTSLALETGKEAHELALKIGYVDLIAKTAATLKDIYKATGEPALALEMFELEMKMRDSLQNESNRKIVIRNELKNDYDRKKAELALVQEIVEQKAERETLIRNFALAGLGIVLIFLVFVVIQRNRISKERKRSDDLLLNILPASVAEELKENGSAKTHAFEEVTVLFTDFKDFTQISERLSPADLVAELDHCFKEFDRIMEKYNVEKIKTTGDAYMAAGGLPVFSATHAFNTVQPALAICAYMTELKKSRDAEGKVTFEIRIGVHTGPVVAGIVGVKKFAYDIWGDTVNIASRMESSGEPGKVNISESTYQLVKEKINCTYRGKVTAKNKGEIAMYFADAVKS